MKNTTTLFFLLLAAFLPHATKAQSVLNPADSVYNYDSLNPPQQPAWGQIGKWVRTPRMTWNTNSYKAYIYKGIPFRLKFPKSYNPAVNDGKKYPMLVFWHGLGEAAENIYDNEFHLLLGCEMFKNNIDNGNFDGYVIAMQTQAELSGFFGDVHYQSMQEIIEYMVTNNKLDRFQVVNNGLSSGGIASINMFLKNPTYISAINAMAPPGDYTSTETVNKIKFTPFWYSNGGQDDNPPPSVADNLYTVMKSAGADFRKLTYPNNYHNTWDNTWAEFDFWGYLKRAYASNPWPLYGKTGFNPGETINVTIGLAPGYEGYEWRKDGVIITGATGNSITATQLGSYDARVMKAGAWSEWSRIPVRLIQKDPSIIHIEAEDFTNMSGVVMETTADAGGGLNIGWQDSTDWMDYSVNVPAAGTYTVSFRVATMFNGPQFQLRNSSQSILTTVTVPNTGWFQSWQTVSVPVTLPAGQQTLRIYTSKPNGGWNINWWEITAGGSTPANQAPVVNAGSNQTITLPQNSVQLSGTASDPDGSISTYSWTKVSGPAGEVFSSPSSAQTTVSNLVEGSYTFRLTVTDNAGATASGDVVVTVNAASTSPSTKIEAENYTAMFGIQTEPTADVGGGLNVGWQDDNDWMDYAVNISTAGTYTVNFRVASMFTGATFQFRDQNGTALATLVVPNTGNFQSWTTISAPVSLAAGSQTVRVYTTAANGGWNLNWLEIVGGSNSTPTTNQSPQVSAGSAQSITLPTSSVQLNGTATDPDGSIVSYSWSQLSGPSAASFSNASAAITTVSNLVEGSYVFQLTVTDNAGATASATVGVTVYAATPPPPTITVNLKIEAESYSSMSGVQTEATMDAGGGLNVSGQDVNDWMSYLVDLPAAGTYNLQFRVACISNGTQFELRRMDGTVIIKLTVPNTGSLQTWQTLTTQVSLPAGQQTLRIYTVKTKKSWNLNWWSISTPGTNAGRTGAVTELRSGMDKELTVYPNPVRDRFVLQLDNRLRGQMKVEIINLLGVVQKQYTLVKKNEGSENFYLDAQSLAPGRYMIRVIQDKAVQTGSVLKQ